MSQHGRLRGKVAALQAVLRQVDNICDTLSPDTQSAVQNCLSRCSDDLQDLLGNVINTHTSKRPRLTSTPPRASEKSLLPVTSSPLFSGLVTAPDDSSQERANGETEQLCTIGSACKVEASVEDDVGEDPLRGQLYCDEQPDPQLSPAEPVLDPFNTVEDPFRDQSLVDDKKPPQSASASADREWEDVLLQLHLSGKLEAQFAELLSNALDEVLMAVVSKMTDEDRALLETDPTSVSRYLPKVECTGNNGETIVNIIYDSLGFDRISFDALRSSGPCRTSEDGLSKKERFVARHCDRYSNFVHATGWGLTGGAGHGFLHGISGLFGSSNVDKIFVGQSTHALETQKVNAVVSNKATNVRVKFRFVSSCSQLRHPGIQVHFRDTPFNLVKNAIARAKAMLFPFIAYDTKLQADSKIYAFRRAARFRQSAYSCQRFCKTGHKVHMQVWTVLRPEEAKGKAAKGKAAKGKAAKGKAAKGKDDSLPRWFFANGWHCSDHAVLSRWWVVSATLVPDPESLLDPESHLDSVQRFANKDADWKHLRADFLKFAINDMMIELCKNTLDCEDVRSVPEQKMLLMCCQQIDLDNIIHIKTRADADSGSIEGKLHKHLREVTTAPVDKPASQPVECEAGTALQRAFMHIEDVAQKNRVHFTAEVKHLEGKSLISSKCSLLRAALAPSRAQVIKVLYAGSVHGAAVGERRDLFNKHNVHAVKAPGGLGAVYRAELKKQFPALDMVLRFSGSNTANILTTWLIGSDATRHTLYRVATLFAQLVLQGVPVESLPALSTPVGQQLCMCRGKFLCLPVNIPLPELDAGPFWTAIIRQVATYLRTGSSARTGMWAEMPEETALAGVAAALACVATGVHPFPAPVSQQIPELFFSSQHPQDRSTKRKGGLSNKRKAGRSHKTKGSKKQESQQRVRTIFQGAASGHVWRHVPVSQRRKRVVLLSDKWGRTSGGVSVYNMELCAALAVLPSFFEVVCVVFGQPPPDGADASKCHVSEKSPTHERVSTRKGTFNVVWLPEDARNADATALAALVEASRVWSSSAANDGASGYAANDIKVLPHAVIGHDLFGAPFVRAAFDLLKTHASPKPWCAVISHTDTVHGDVAKMSAGSGFREHDFRCQQLKKHFTKGMYLAAVTPIGKDGSIDGEDEHLVLTPGLSHSLSMQRGPAPRHDESPLVVCVGRLDDRNKGGWNIKRQSSQLPGLFAQSNSMLGQIATQLRNMRKKQSNGKSQRFTGKVQLIGTPEGDDRLVLSAAVKLTTSKFSVATMPFEQDEDKLREALSGATLVIVPSMTEAFPLVAVEAISCGTPVLVTAASGFPRVFDDLADKLNLPILRECTMPVSAETEKCAKEWVERIWTFRQRHAELRNAFRRVADAWRDWDAVALDLWEWIDNHVKCDPEPRSRDSSPCDDEYEGSTDYRVGDDDDSSDEESLIESDIN